MDYRQGARPLAIDRQGDVDSQATETARLRHTARLRDTQQG